MSTKTVTSLHSVQFCPWCIFLCQLSSIMNHRSQKQVVLAISTLLCYIYCSGILLRCYLSCFCKLYFILKLFVCIMNQIIYQFNITLILYNINRINTCSISSSISKRTYKWISNVTINIIELYHCITKVFTSFMKYSLLYLIRCIITCDSCHIIAMCLCIINKLYQWNIAQ